MICKPCAPSRVQGKSSWVSLPARSSFVGKRSQKHKLLDHSRLSVLSDDEFGECRTTGTKTLRRGGQREVILQKKPQNGNNF